MAVGDGASWVYPCGTWDLWQIRVSQDWQFYYCDTRWPKLKNLK
jgi:hypothetical protein